uniref:Uncharacterized protein n=1 Tax=Anopheles arabiensis TaxID=7173 RepID=A0A182IFM4_ANOAR
MLQPPTHRHHLHHLPLLRLLHPPPRHRCLHHLHPHSRHHHRRRRHLLHPLPPHCQTLRRRCCSHSRRSSNPPDPPPGCRCTGRLAKLLPHPILRMSPPVPPLLWSRQPCLPHRMVLPHTLCRIHPDS